MVNDSLHRIASLLPKHSNATRMQISGSTGKKRKKVDANQDVIREVQLEDELTGRNKFGGMILLNSLTALVQEQVHGKLILQRQQGGILLMDINSTSTR